MKGEIAAKNMKRGMVAIRTEGGDYSVFELLSYEDVQIGDPVSWRNDKGLGHEVLFNRRTAIKIEVYFQNHEVAKSNLKAQLLIG